MTDLALIDDGTLIVKVLDRLLTDLDLVSDVYRVADPWGPVEEATASLEPEVVLITDSHPRLTYLCEQLSLKDDVAILVLGASPAAPPDLVPQARYLRWQADANELSTALTAVRHNTGPWSIHVVDSPFTADPGAHSPQFSPREIEVMNAAAIGLTNSSIARKLAVSEATIKTYWRRVFAKLEVRDRTAAVAAGMAIGVVSIRCWCEDSADTNPQVSHTPCVVCRSRRCTTSDERPRSIVEASRTAVAR